MLLQRPSRLLAGLSLSVSLLAFGQVPSSPATRVVTHALAAGAPAADTPLLQPTSVAYDQAGNLYFAESRNHVIRRVDSSGNMTVVAGSATQGFSGDGGDSTRAELDSPRGVAVDAQGNIFIADTRNNRIRRVDAITHLITTIAGTGTPSYRGDSGPATNAALALPLALALDGANHLFIADTGNQRIRRIDLGTGLITTVAGNGAQGFSGDGAAAANAALNTPSGLAADSFGNLFIADTGNHRIREVNATSQVILTLSGAGTAGYALTRPEGLSLNHSGGLLIADVATHRIYLLDVATGRLTVVAGQGTQAFTGDRGLATLAMLDSPAGIAVAPSGLLAVADTGNQRVRQISPETGNIITIAGLGGLVSGVLTLAGPSTQSYGSATLLATLSSSSIAQGAVTLLDATSAGTSAILTAPLAGGLVGLDLTSLSAGQHRLTATFAGDATEASAQSAAFALKVVPLPLTATMASPVTLFGEPAPALTATLAGALPRDLPNLAVAITSSATQRSPPGVYPIGVSLVGSAAPNYILAPTAGTLTVNKAPVIASITSSPNGLNIEVASTTSGIPTGSVTVLTSAGTQLSSAPLNASGAAVLNAASLPSGSYELTAIYSGDADFLAGRSSAATVVLGAPVVPADFTLASNGSSTQTINSGETASFPFTLKTSGASLSGPITLAVAGAPAFASATFDPGLIPPGGTIGNFTLSVRTARATATSSPSQSSKWVAFGFFLPLLGLRRLRRSGLKHLALGAALLVGICGCGNRVNTVAAGQTPATVYPLIVTGTTTNLDGTTLQHSVSVSLTVQ